MGLSKQGYKYVIIRITPLRGLITPIIIYLLSPMIL